jgi:cytochrome c peroxidase
MDMSSRSHAVLMIGLASLAAGCRERTEQGEPGAPTRADAAVAPPSSAPKDEPAVELPEPPALEEAPRGLPPIASPAHNPTTPEKVELGRLMFFDPRLSASGKTSCASCHQPERGWADGVARANTDAGQPNLRHTPSLANTGYQRAWGWDGGMPTLEAQVLSHWKGQLGGPPDAALRLLTGAPGYAARFSRAFSTGPQRERVAEALAAYARTVVSGDAPWDRHEGGAGAVGPDAVAGFEVFSKRAGCATCHPPPLYTDHDHHARAGEAHGADPGRKRISGEARDEGAFKTPGLRGLVHTAPYFHDGSAATLEEAVAAELARGQISLSAVQRGQLLAFLRALSPPPIERSAPELPAMP